MQFIVQYSHSRDLETYINGMRRNLGSNFGVDHHQLAINNYGEKFVDKVFKAKTNTEAELIIIKFWLKNRKPDFIKNVLQNVQDINNYLDQRKDEIISELEKLYGHQFPFEKIGIYLTSFYSFPYWYPSFFTVPAFQDNEKIFDTAIHELNHFMYYYYFEKKVKDAGFSHQESENLKESLAVLTSRDPENENKYKTIIKPIQNFVYQNRDKNINDIIDLVMASGILKQ